MNCLWGSRGEKDHPSEYATVEDFRNIFTEETNKLHLLALLLTGDEAKAEQCFVAGLEDSVSSNKVFRDWARSWAKRTIIKNAIEAIQPRPSVPVGSSRTTLQKKGMLPSRSALHVELQRVLALEDLDRFVFVMSVLEGYSEKECSLLLGCSPLEVHDARTRALDHIEGQNSSAVFEAQFNGSIATDAATMDARHFVQARSF
jgi:DNA-directed RNA polymerase specialized sigma24 family protein